VSEAVSVFQQNKRNWIQWHVIYKNNMNLKWLISSGQIGKRVEEKKLWDRGKGMKAKKCTHL
jgi:hypothetical protein